MAKVIKRAPSGPVKDRPRDRKKAVVFGLAIPVVRQMTAQLEKEKLTVAAVTDERKLLQTLHDVDPYVVFIEIETAAKKSTEDMVADVFAWSRARARAINKFLNSPSGLLWQKARVVLFKTEATVNPVSSLSEEMADTDEVIRKCSLLGRVNFIGIYSPFSFISKVRADIED